MEENRKTLYNISNQMIEIFIKDTLSKNKVDLENAKAKMSDEQREALKETVTQLKEQVEEFIYTKKSKKTVTEDNKVEDNARSPIRKNILKNKAKEKVEED